MSKANFIKLGQILIAYSYWFWRKKDAQTARLLHIGDGVVIGSALISKIEANPDDPHKLKTKSLNC